MKNKIIIKILILLFIVSLTFAGNEAGEFRETFLFDGIDDLIVVPDNESLNTPSMTISFEFKLIEGLSLKSGNNKTRQFIIFKKNPMEHFNEGIAVYYNEEGNNLLATVSNLSRNQVFAYTKKGTIEKDVWYKVTASADSNDIRLYIDTILQNSNPTGFSLYFDKEPLLIGGRSNVMLEQEKYGGMFSGELKNIRIYNKSITEIGESYYFSGDSSLDSMLILDYPYHESAGIVRDRLDKNNGVILKGRPTSNELQEPDYVRIHPNPVKEKSEIYFRLQSASEVKVVLRDLAGNDIKVIHEGLLKKGEHRLNFQPDSIQSGYYVCFVETGSEVRTASFIITK